MSGIDSQFSLSRAEIQAVELRMDHWTSYVSFERRAPWLVVEITNDIAAPVQRRTMFSRHEESGIVKYDRGDA